MAAARNRSGGSKAGSSVSRMVPQCMAHSRLRPELAADRHAFLGRAVRPCHQRPRLVGADRHQGEVRLGHARCRLGEHRAVGGVAGEQDRPARSLQQEAAPQAGVAVEQAALAEMDRGQGGDARCRRPPPAAASPARRPGRSARCPDSATAARASRRWCGRAPAAGPGRAGPDGRSDCARAAAGRSAAGAPAAGRARRSAAARTRRTGEARSVRNGSVRIVLPPSRIRKLAWPSQVTASAPSRSRDAGQGHLGRQHVAVGDLRHRRALDQPAPEERAPVRGGAATLGAARRIAKGAVGQVMPREHAGVLGCGWG